MSTVVEQQFADLVSVMGIEGKLAELQASRQSERVEALTAELAQEREGLATDASDLQNAQAKLDKVRVSQVQAARKADELESQNVRATAAKHRAGVKVSKRKARIGELVAALAGLGVDDA